MANDYTPSPIVLVLGAVMVVCTLYLLLSCERVPLVF